tara:strand:+ start:3054 stop:5315 length:2262 start_codon:yes stop_codon:yes gene_type:complete
MNDLSKFLVDSILNEAEEGITVMLPGGFKPPHEGHLMLAKGYEDMPQVKEVVILIGPKERDGITLEDSEKIWEKLLVGTKKIRVERSKYPSPLLTAYKYIEEKGQPGESYALGSSSKGSDYDRIRGFVDQHQDDGKYSKDGVSVVELPLDKSKPLFYKNRTDDQNGKPTSASQLRADLAANDFENFKTNYPSIKSDQQIRTIFDLLSKKKIKEDHSQSTLDEVVLRKHFEALKGKFKSFTEKLKQEGKETKSAFLKIVNAVKKGEKLSKEERVAIGDQLKDVLKLAGFTAASVLPGGVIYLLLARMPLLQKTLTPSAFQGVDTPEELLAISESRTLLKEGGAAGHMAHPYEDMDMTFDDIEDMIDAALTGKVEYAQEKLDGQNLMVTYKDGKVLSARNKGQLKNAAEKAMTKNDMEKSMQHLPDNVRNAFLDAMQDITDAISKLNPTEKEDFFGNGTKFVNMELLHPASENVAAYGVTQLRMHNVQEYDENGNVVGSDSEAPQKIQQALDRVEASKQDTYEIRATDLVNLKQTKDYEKQKEQLIKDLNNVRSKYQLTKGDKLGLYFQNFWSAFIKNNAKTYKYDIPDDVLQNIINRWAFSSKEVNLRILKKSIENQEFLQWFSNMDKGRGVREEKKIAAEPIEDIFLKLGVFVLKSLEGLVAINPNDSVMKMKRDLASAVETIQRKAANNDIQDDDASLRFLKAQMKRLKKMGGFDAIVPSEGIVFKHKGKLYKLTGAFAPINQIIGYIKFGR